ncbi:hypothetical protein HDU96_001474 [Phlyctochytrium bullatum]|nr:hypothetical protein HDU96_001474 [Phlyctochytrium bullatum]
MATATTDPPMLLRLPWEVTHGIMGYLHPHTVRRLQLVCRRAHRAFNLTGYTVVAKHLWFFVEAESRRRTLTDHARDVTAVELDILILASIAWFFVDPNYIVALIMKLGGIHCTSLRILLPEFRSLDELPPQPHPDITPILRAYSEAIDRGLPLRPPDLGLEDLYVDTDMQASTCTFALLWFSAVDAVDLFIEVIQRLESSDIPNIHTRLAPLLEIAFQSAATYGSIGTVRYLLDRGVDPRTADNYAIQLASENGHAAVVDALLETGLVDPSSEESYALGTAAENGHEEVVRMLLAHSNARPGDDSDYALRFALANGHVEIVKMLLETGECNPSSDDFFVLKEAARMGYEEILEALRLY